MYIPTVMPIVIIAHRVSWYIRPHLSASRPGWLLLQFPTSSLPSLSFTHLSKIEYIFLCRHDYLKIGNENNRKLDVYCGRKIGHTVFVTGNYAIITFHSNIATDRRGYLIFFSAVPHGKNSQNVL